jgi:hypothetical protein
MEQVEAAELAAPMEAAELAVQMEAAELTEVAAQAA